MAALFGRVDAFEENTETWEHYTERLGHYFDANGIGDESGDDKAKRRAILLSVCGSKVYKLMCDLLAPAKPKEKSYQELVKLMQDYLAPKPSEFVQRFKFNNRLRNEGESVADFVAALRNKRLRTRETYSLLSSFVCYMYAVMAYFHPTLSFQPRWKLLPKTWRCFRNRRSRRRSTR